MKLVCLLWGHGLSNQDSFSFLDAFCTGGGLDVGVVRRRCVCKQVFLAGLTVLVDTSAGQ